MSIQVAWIDSVGAGECSSCGARGKHVGVALIRIEYENTAQTFKLCKRCVEELIKRLQEKLEETGGTI